MSSSLHLDTQARRAADLKRRLIVAAAASAPIMVISMVPALQFPGWQWASLILSLPVVTWCAWPFHSQAFRAAQHGQTTMNTLISLGIVASMGWSIYALAFTDAGHIGMRMSMSLLPRSMDEHAHVYFEGATMIATFLLLGRWLEARARHRAGDAMRSLLELGAKKATRLIPTDGGEIEEEVDTADLAVGDLVRVRPGEKIPADGTVARGTSALDQSVVTGESLPLDVGPGDTVVGGTLNTTGTLVVETTAVGSDTLLANIARMVTEAQAGKAPVQRLADRVSAVFVPVIIAIAAATFLGWMMAGAGLQQAMTSAVAVLVVACPCALGLATPTALLVGSGRGAQAGIIFRGPEVLEGSHAIDAVVLDKTGTLTTGTMRVARVITSEGDAHRVDDPRSREILTLAGAAESPSEHPIARALTHAARDIGCAFPTIERFGNHPGMGVHALVKERMILAGRLSWLAEQGLDVPAALAAAAREAEGQGATTIAVAEVHEDRTAVISAEDPENEDESRDLVIDLTIGGMSCAACVGRVEKALRKVDGVDAAVNLATESARVRVSAEHPQASNPDALTTRLIELVTHAGYEARRLDGQHAPTPRRHRDDLLGPLTGGTVLGLVTVSDELRPTSAQAIADLKAAGITPHLATGDNAGAARHVAAQVGIDDVHASVMPADKRDLVAALQERGHHVAMVGDGINDAAALAQAGTRGLGMAMGSGTDIAIAAADITLMRPSVAGVYDAIDLGRATLRVIKENLAWAFGYNIVAVPIAIAGLLNPMLASAFMACSSVLVVANSLRLRRALSR